MDVGAEVLLSGCVLCVRAQNLEPLDLDFGHDLRRLSDYVNIYFAGVAARRGCHVRFCNRSV